MDIRKQAEKLPGILKKYKYAVLVLAIGLVLMALPSKKTEQIPAEQQSSAEMKTADPAGELEKILAQIHGVGRVQVLLTVKAGERSVYQTDEDITTSENNSTVRKETVIITDSQRNELPLVLQVLPPEYMGAVIVCQGAENVQVRLAIVEAVCNATGLGADKIAVLKMK
jgi:stage III sporulation protein AG